MTSENYKEKEQIQFLKNFRKVQAGLSGPDFSNNPALKIWCCQPDARAPEQQPDFPENPGRIIRGAGLSGPAWPDYPA